MKRSLIRSILAAFMVIVGAYVAPAQQLGCVPDCPGDMFSLPTMTSLTLPNGCQVDVIWAVRTTTCAGPYYDIAIYQMRFRTPQCYTPPLASIMTAIITNLLRLNPMGFPPTAGTDPCQTNYRVLYGACWQQDAQDNEILYSCAGSNVCCLTHYTVCISNGQRIVTRGETEQGSCGVVTNPNCVFICN